MLTKIPVYLWLALVPLLWGINFHLAHYAVSYLAPNTVGALRFSLATLLLTPLFLYKESFSWSTIKPLIPAMFMVGLLSVFGYNFLFFKAMKTTSATNGALLMAINPLATLLISAGWLKTRISTVQILGVILGIVGVLLVIARGELQALAQLKINSGDLLVLCIAVTFALSNLIVRRYLHGISSMATSAITTIIGTSMLLAGYFTETQPSISHSDTPGLVWVAIIAMTLGGSIIGYLAWNYSVAKAGAEKAAIFTNLTPFYTALISLALGEELLRAQWLGGVLIVTGILISNLKTKTTPELETCQA